MAKYFPNKPFTRLVAQTEAKPLVDRVLTETFALSKRYVPVRAPRKYDRRPTGRLKRSLKKTGPRVLVNSVKGNVGSRLPFAISVHDGAGPHRIVARSKPRLFFFWENAGRVFSGDAVNHPGVRRFARTQYLYLPLAAVGRRHGFIVRRLTPGSASPLP